MAAEGWGIERPCDLGFSIDISNGVRGGVLCQEVVWGRGTDAAPTAVGVALPQTRFHSVVPASHTNHQAM